METGDTLLQTQGDVMESVLESEEITEQIIDVSYEEFVQAYAEFELSARKTKPLKEITEKISLRHEIEQSIKYFLSKKKFSKDEYSDIIEHLTKIVEEYNLIR